MKLLGIDYGRRRIGLAVTDHSGEIIRGLETLDCGKNRDAATRLLRIIEQEAPDRIVFGLPLSSDDRETAMSAEIRTFAGTIAAESGRAVTFVDESYTSEKAALMLRSRKKKVRRARHHRDRIAACLILQTYQREQA